MLRIALRPLVVTVCLPAFAQTGPFHFEDLFPRVFDEGDDRRVDIAPAVGTLTRLVAGDFTGDARVDAATLDGAGILLARGIAVLNDLNQVNVVANDLAAGPPLDPPGPQTLWAATDTGLLCLHDWDGASFAQTPVGGASWEGALRVLVDRATPRLVGLAADGLTILVLDDPFGAAAAGSFAMTAPVLDVALLDWDGDGTLDVALATTGGLFVRQTDGTPLFSVPGGIGSAVMVGFEQLGFAADRLAIVVTWPGGTDQFLHVIDKDTVDAVVAFGPVGVHALAAEDVNDDQADDLLVMHRYSHDAALFFNQSQGQPPVSGQKTFSFLAGELIPLGPPGAPGLGQASNPVLLDLDLDGDVDMMVPVDARGEMLLQMSTARDESKAQFKLGTDHRYTLDEAQGHCVLELELLAPETPTPSGANLVEVNLYEWPAITESADPYGTPVAQSLASGWDLDLQAVFGESQMLIDKYYVVELRPIVGGGLGSITEAGPSTLFAFATHMDLVSDLYGELGGTEEIVPIPPWLLEQGSSTPVPYPDPTERELAPASIKIPEIEL